MKRGFTMIFLGLAIISAVYLGYQFYENRMYKGAEEYLREKYGENFICLKTWDAPKEFASPFGKSQYHLYFAPANKRDLEFICLLNQDKKPYGDDYVQRRLGYELLPGIKEAVAEQAGDFALTVKVEDFYTLSKYLDKTGVGITLEQAEKIARENPDLNKLQVRVALLVKAGSIKDLPSLLNTLEKIVQERDLILPMSISLLVLSDKDYGSGEGFTKNPPGWLEYFVEERCMHSRFQAVKLVLSTDKNSGQLEFYKQKAVLEYEQLVKNGK